MLARQNLKDKGFLRYSIDTSVRSTPTLSTRVKQSRFYTEDWRYSYLWYHQMSKYFKIINEIQVTHIERQQTQKLRTSCQLVTYAGGYVTVNGNIHNTKISYFQQCSHAWLVLSRHSRYLPGFFRKIRTIWLKNILAPFARIVSVPS